MAKSGRHKSKRVQLEERLILAMNHRSDSVVGIERIVDLTKATDDERAEHQKEHIPFIRITAHGLEHDSMRRELFLREFNQDLLYEEWPALFKFWEIAMEKNSNSEQAIALLERMFQVKIKELEGKEMAELVTLHNDLATKAGKPVVEKFKSVEAAKIAIVKLSNEKPAAKTKAAKATGKGQDGRPRTGVGAAAKALLAKGKSNTEVLEAIKKEFHKNSTTLSCIAYYRAHMVKDGLLPKSVAKPKAKDAKKGNSKATKAAKKPAAKKGKPKAAAAAEPAAAAS